MNLNEVKKELAEEGLSYKRDMSIDPNALDVEWCEQANLLMRYCEAVAVEKANVGALEERKAVVSAEVAQNMRLNPREYGLEKMTEAAIPSLLTQDERIQSVNQDLAKARFRLEILQGAVRSIEHRKSALEYMVQLYGKQYFAGPSVPRDLGSEFLKRKERESARDKVKKHLNKSE